MVTVEIEFLVRPGPAESDALARTAEQFGRFMGRPVTITGPGGAARPLVQ